MHLLRSFLFLVSNIDKCTDISDGITVGNVEYPAINEASGLVYSRTDEHILFWTLNDSDVRKFHISYNGPHLEDIVVINCRSIL